MSAKDRQEPTAESASPPGSRVRRCPACASYGAPSERAGWLRTERDGLRCDRCWARFEYEAEEEL